MYQCINCGEKFDDLPQDVIRCPSCAFKILFKVRDPITKKIKSR